jgi:high-affinity nickel-transport protein
LKLQGAGWDAIEILNHNFGTLGYFIIGIFALCWAGSVFIYRVKRFDELEIIR